MMQDFKSRKFLITVVCLSVNLFMLTQYVLLVYLYTCSKCKHITIALFTRLKT